MKDSPDSRAMRSVTAGIARFLRSFREERERKLEQMKADIRRRDLVDERMRELKKLREQNAAGLLMGERVENVVKVAAFKPIYDYIEPLLYERFRIVGGGPRMTTRLIDAIVNPEKIKTELALYTGEVEHAGRYALKPTDWQHKFEASDDGDLLYTYGQFHVPILMSPEQALTNLKRILAERMVLPD